MNGKNKWGHILYEFEIKQYEIINNTHILPNFKSCIQILQLEL